MIVSGAELVVAGLGVDIEGRHIVQDVDFVAHPGQVVGILGPMGVASRRCCAQSSTRDALRRGQ